MTPDPTTPTYPPLPEHEQVLLDELERVLAGHAMASLESAKALHIIDTKRLFRGHGNSLKMYGKRWGYNGPQTYKLAKCGEIYFSLEPLWRDQGLPAPTSEWQMRSLGKLTDVPAQMSAWKEAVSRSNGAAPTGDMVDTCVAEQLGTPPVPSEPPVVKKTRMRLDLDQVSGLADFISEEAERQGVTPQELVLEVLADFAEKRTAIIADVVASAYEDLSLCGIL